MFNMTKVEIELIPYPDKYILFEKGTRVFLYSQEYSYILVIYQASYIPNRHSIANNKCLKSYDPKQESTHYILRRK